MNTLRLKLIALRLSLPAHISNKEEQGGGFLLFVWCRNVKKKKREVKDNKLSQSVFSVFNVRRALRYSCVWDHVIMEQMGYVTVQGHYGYSQLSPALYSVL